MRRTRPILTLRTHDDNPPRAARWVGKMLYWLAVTAVSLAVVSLVLQLIHSLDGATVALVPV